MSVNTVLVTGAFGQVGKRCTEILLERGRTVIALDLRNDRSVALAQELSERGHPGTLIAEYVDLLDAAAVRDLVSVHHPDAIVHLAAIYSPPSYRDPRFARKVNVEGTRNLVQAAKALDAPPLVLKASSAAVYGSINPHRYPQRITPETPVNPIDQYGEDKLLAEGVVRDRTTEFMPWTRAMSRKPSPTRPIEVPSSTARPF
jgi:nucleoside-diphosphate-sugar epimerase